MHWMTSIIGRAMMKHCDCTACLSIDSRLFLILRTIWFCLCDLSTFQFICLYVRWFIVESSVSRAMMIVGWVSVNSLDSKDVCLFAIWILRNYKFFRSFQNSRESWYWFLGTFRTVTDILVDLQYKIFTSRKIAKYLTCRFHDEHYGMWDFCESHQVWQWCLLQTLQKF